MRHKSTYFINVPNFADKFFTATVSFLNAKLKSRVKVRVNFLNYYSRLITIDCFSLQFFSGQNDLQKFIDSKYLPKEYGGEIPMATMIGLYIR